MDKNDTRFPYTYACDLIRSKSRCDSNGVRISRSEAAQIIGLIAIALQMNEREFAAKLAYYYIEHENEITTECLRQLKIAGII